MTTLTSPEPAVRSAETIFSRILVGVDGSPESLEAARQAAALERPGGTTTLLGAWHLAPPLVTPMTVLPAWGVDESEARAEAEDALRAVRQELPSAAALLVHGFPAHALIGEARRAGSTLIAVGSHGQRRLAGILMGSTATQLAHEAPCSLLVARAWPAGRPRRIAVGVDGSDGSAAAYAAAQYLARRFDAELRPIVAEGDKLLDLPAVSLVVGDGFDVVSDDPVAALTAASTDADLLVLGSRGVHGLRALGSVSERVVHRAACSTLIVRGR
jgi:nucleotide-binding universal stress UspA family protein